MLINKNLQSLLKFGEEFIEKTKPNKSPKKTSMVAEIGINHNGSLKLAKKLIKIANHCGFQYVKFQKRYPDICVPKEKKKEMRDTPKGKMKYIEYKREIEFGYDEFKKLFEFSEDLNIDLFSSLWDVESAKFMNEFTNIGKIPSPMITNKKLLKKTKNLYDFIILSTGMSTQSQIDEAVDILNPDVIMHSVSSYPTKPEEININYIKYLKDNFENINSVGYSGHEKDVINSAASVLIGSDWIERHVTIDNSLWGSDQSMSLQPKEFYELIENVKLVEKAKNGYERRKILESEIKKKKDLRKSDVNS